MYADLGECFRRGGTLRQVLQALWMGRGGSGEPEAALVGGGRVDGSDAVRAWSELEGGLFGVAGAGGWPGWKPGG